MNFRKSLTIAIAFVCVLLLAGWLMRNSLIQRLSGPILAEFDIELVDVSLDALATRNAQIGYLELVHAKGTTVTIEGLTLPIGRSADGSQTYTAEKVSIVTATRTEGEPFELARLIDQYLSLPEYLADSEIQVAELSLAPYPTLHDLHWKLSENGQTLRATVASIEIEIGATRVDEREHEMRFAIPETDVNGIRHTVAAHVRRNNAGIAIAGAASIELPAWQRLAKLAGVIPDPVTVESGNALLEFESGIPYRPDTSPSVTLTLTPSAALQLGYAIENTSTVSIAVTSASPLNIHASFPVVEWQLRQDQAALQITYDEWENIPLLITDLTCNSEKKCEMNSRIRMEEADLPFGNVERLDAISSQIFDFSAADPRLELHSGGKLNANGITTSDASIDSWESELTAAASLSISNAGWEFAAESVDANIELLSIGDNLLLSGPIFLESITVADYENVATAKLDVLAPAPHARLDSQSILLPGLQGSIARRDDSVEFELVTIDLFENGNIRGVYEFSSGQGDFSLTDTIISFTDRELSKWFASWNKDWDVIAGAVAVAGRVALNEDSAENLSGHVNVGATDLAGYFGDTAFTGLSTEIDATYAAIDGANVMPSTVSVALIDVGLPVRNLTADFELTPDFRGADITNLRMNAFEGIITADPFSFRTDKASNTMIMRAESLDISDMLTLKEFDAVEVTGRIGAALPITITTDGITIAAGSLTGEAPGGVIRYAAGDVTDEAVSSSIGMVKEALSHFEYDTLTSELNYNQDGDLELAMQLKGRNPDMEGSRPVILNLNVQNNVPQMLKSLQAARAVEELLEKQLAE
ncbi:MAG: intermembrane phospholipid transport protein YdbH family protein [Woeseiaceae bacterium]